LYLHALLPGSAHLVELKHICTLNGLIHIVNISPVIGLTLSTRRLFQAFSILLFFVTSAKPLLAAIEGVEIRAFSGDDRCLTPDVIRYEKAA
jgi:hypothetical protein